MNQTPTKILYEKLADKNSFISQWKVTNTSTCSHCLDNDVICTPMKDVLSHSFTGWDNLRFQDFKNLCLPCAWSYQNPEVKKLRLLIWRNSEEIIKLPSDQGLTLLKESPEQVSAIFAINGQKQLLPLAKWGTFIFDNRSFQWGTYHSDLLRAVSVVKSFGLTEKSLWNDAPPISFTKSNSVFSINDFLKSWQQLQEAKRNNKDLITLMTWLNRNQGE